MWLGYLPALIIMYNVLCKMHGSKQTNYNSKLCISILFFRLGLLSDEEVPQVCTPLDALCSLLTKKLAYGMYMYTARLTLLV